MVQSSDSGPLALPLDEVIRRSRRVWPPDHKTVPPLPETTEMPSADEVATHPLIAAEVAQAKLFERALRAEISRLEPLAAAMANRSINQHRLPVGRPPEQLAELRAHVAELHRLLATLRSRFLYPG